MFEFIFRTEAVSAIPWCGAWAMLAAPTAGGQAHSGYCPAHLESLHNQGFDFLSMRGSTAVVATL